jgi:hypothetical protein
MKKTVKVDAEIHKRIRTRVADEGGTIEDYVNAALVHSFGFRTFAPKRAAKRRTKEKPE